MRLQQSHLFRHQAGELPLHRRHLLPRIGHRHQSQTDHVRSALSETLYCADQQQVHHPPRGIRRPAHQVYCPPPVMLGPINRGKGDKGTWPSRLLASHTCYQVRHRILRKVFASQLRFSKSVSAGGSLRQPVERPMLKPISAACLPALRSNQALERGSNCSNTSLGGTPSYHWMATPSRSARRQLVRTLAMAEPERVNACGESRASSPILKTCRPRAR